MNNKIKNIKRRKWFKRLLEEEADKKVEDKIKYMEYKPVICVPIKMQPKLLSMDVFVELAKIADVMEIVSKTEIGRIFGKHLEIYKKKGLIEIRIDKLQKMERSN